jgi:hypothetical protein
MGVATAFSVRSGLKRGKPTDAADAVQVTAMPCEGISMREDLADVHADLRRANACLHEVYDLIVRVEDRTRSR